MKAKKSELLKQLHERLDSLGDGSGDGVNWDACSKADIKKDLETFSRYMQEERRGCSSHHPGLYEKYEKLVFVPKGVNFGCSNQLKRFIAACPATPGQYDIQIGGQHLKLMPSSADFATSTQEYVKKFKLYVEESGMTLDIYDCHILLVDVNGMSVVLMDTMWNFPINSTVHLILEPGTGQQLPGMIREKRKKNWEDPLKGIKHKRGKK